MAERGKFETTEKRIRTAYSKLGMAGVVVGLFALLATVVSVVILLPAEKAEVAAQVLASDNLTTYHPDMEAKFTYEGEEVTHLWKLKVRFVNSGDKTIIGTGNQKNILGEGLNFVFPDDTRILRIEEESETFESNVEQMEQNHFEIQFSQWRSGEYNIASFYIASEKSLEAVPCPSVPTRNIIDGDVIIQDLTERAPRERVAIIDRLPRPISLAAKIMGGLVAGVLTIIIIIVLTWGWKDSLPFIMWKRRYFSSFATYLDQVEPKLSAYRKQMFTSDPTVLPEKLWTKFDGPKVPLKSPMFESITTGGVITLVLFGVLFGSISLILMLFPL